MVERGEEWKQIREWQKQRGNELHHPNVREGVVRAIAGSETINKYLRHLRTDFDSSTAGETGQVLAMGLSSLGQRGPNFPRTWENPFFPRTRAELEELAYLIAVATVEGAKEVITVSNLIETITSKAEKEELRPGSLYHTLLNVTRKGLPPPPRLRDFSQRTRIARVIGGGWDSPLVPRLSGLIPIVQISQAGLSLFKSASHLEELSIRSLRRAQRTARRINPSGAAEVAEEVVELNTVLGRIMAGATEQAQELIGQMSVSPQVNPLSLGASLEAAKKTGEQAKDIKRLIEERKKRTAFIRNQQGAGLIAVLSVTNGISLSHAAETALALAFTAEALAHIIVTSLLIKRLEQGIAGLRVIFRRATGTPITPTTFDEAMREASLPPIPPPMGLR